eukprot:s2062_g3.t1
MSLSEQRWSGVHHLLRDLETAVACVVKRRQAPAGHAATVDAPAHAPDAHPRLGSKRDATGVVNSLTTLVPTFDPSKDSLKIYQQKVELVLAAWPKTKITELVMRLILNCQGSAFAKLQLHQTELMENDEKSVKRLVELLGGHWGRIGLERQYEEAEQALFNTCQLKDESNDSYLARADIAWSKFLSQKLSLSDLQAFVLLRGSTLTPEEKKRVILESDNSLEGKLTVNRVSEAVRLLGATFFQELTGQKSVTKQKVYSADTLLVADHEDNEDLGLHTQDEMCEDDFVECLINEGDDDATLVCDFESAAAEVIQDDPELASAFSAYTEARRRLSEKFRNRGFWATSTKTSSTSKGKFGSKGSGKSKGSFPQRPRRSLQDRILNSYCRNCNRKGHWKAECPYKSTSGTGQSSTAGGSTSMSVPATTALVDSSSDIFPLEFMDLPDTTPAAQNDALPLLVQVCSSKSIYEGPRKLSYYSSIQGESTGNSQDTWVKGPTARERLQSWGFRNDRQEHAKKRLAATMLSQSQCILPEGRQTSVRAESPHQKSDNTDHSMDVDVSEATICFATHGSHGILDLGASKTVIGSDHIAELIQSLSTDVRQRLSRCKCNITFRPNPIVPKSLFPVVTANMSSLSQRLRALQIPTTASQESLEHLTLAELSEETISFGQKHQGHTYLEAWEDQEWVQFMINRYQGSTKDAHRRFLRFIELKVEDMEKNQPVVPRSSQQGGASRLQAKSKAAPKTSAGPAPISLLDGDGEDDWDVASEMCDPVITGYATNQISENVAALQTRMLHMEDALGRVIKHIEDQAMLNKGN